MFLAAEHLVDPFAGLGTDIEKGTLRRGFRHAGIAADRDHGTGHRVTGLCGVVPGPGRGGMVLYLPGGPQGTLKARDRSVLADGGPGVCSRRFTGD